MKNKTHLIMLFIGVILVMTGVLWSFLGTNSSNSDDNKKSGFTGRYKKSEIILDIYQINDNEAYYVINNIYGKGKINNNTLLGVKDNVNYQFTMDNNTINLVTDNKNISGVYTKENSITFDEFFINNYGSLDYLNSKYNGIFKDEFDNEADVYQVGENKFLVLSNFIPEKDKILIFELNSEGLLEKKLNNYFYTVYIKDDLLVFAKHDTLDDKEIRFQTKEISRTDKFTKESIIDFTMKNNIVE